MPKAKATTTRKSKKDAGGKKKKGSFLLYPALRCLVYIQLAD